jgi:hypothetical protein
MFMFRERDFSACIYIEHGREKLNTPRRKYNRSDEPEQANVVLLWKDRKICVLFCVRNIL